MVSNLNPATTYEWQVQTICNGYTSPYSQPAYFSTIDTCGYISSVSAINIKTTSATLAWGNTSAMDTVRIRVTNVATGSIRVIVLNYNPSNGQYQLKGLHSNTTYKVEVKGKCSSGATGTWSAPLTFTTSVLSSRVDDGGIFELVGYPNPTSDVLSYTFSTEEKSDYQLNVTDLSGRTIMHETRNAQDGENTSDINVTSFAKGIYIMTIQIGTETSRFKFTVQ
ncbi:MAG TPA: T9SS type A sorting domain-containing protein [Bacteroidia bacterium]|nr:T9SS type A sorting domain-containing protein [Bacteroidia bacterium]